VTATPITFHIDWDDDHTILAVAGRHMVTVDELRSPARSQRLVAARRSIAVELRVAGWSLKRIGRAIGRHHTAVLHHLLDDATMMDQQPCPPG